MNLFRRLCSAVLALSLILSMTVFVSAEPIGSGPRRVFGSTRYETAFAVADALQTQLDTALFDAVIIASGKNFPDALSASYLAAKKNAPILLSDGSNTADLTAWAEAHLTAAGTIYILGGENAISAQTEAGFSAGGHRTVRLGGADRYETNIRILREAGVSGEEILVCTGAEYADSLCAAATGLPILLVSGKGLTDDQLAILEDASGICIIGGEKAVSAETASRLPGSAVRIGGADRYETSALVATRFWSDPEAAVLAYARNFPDALCAGVLANAMGGPLLLVTDSAWNAAGEYVQSHDISDGIALGGPGLIGDHTVRSVFGLAQQTEIPVWVPETDDMGRIKEENVAAVLAYADQLYADNIKDDHTAGGYTWHGEDDKPNWIYYTGLVHEGLLSLDFDRFAPEVQKFYTQHIQDNGAIQNYATGTLDAALPAINILTLLENDTLTPAERSEYEAAVRFVYGQLEDQITYPEAGDLMMHAQDANGDPHAGWDIWSVCLDGVYMSQTFLIRLANAIDSGVITVFKDDGTPVTSEEIWDAVFQRLTFVLEHMRDEETGLLYHGYCVAEQRTNGIVWSRGLGWFSMILMEAAEQIPGADRKAALEGHFRDLMEAIVAQQDPVTLLWYNVTTCREEVSLQINGETILNIPESSGSAMFAYCLLRGYQNGILGEDMYRAGLRAFNALVETRLTEDGLADICLKSAVHTSANMYQAFGYVTNDGKGAGPLLLAADYVLPADPAEAAEENTDKVLAYANRLYTENIREDYSTGGFTWDKANRTSNWIYFTGLMHDAFLATDFDRYYSEVKKYYDQHIQDNGKISGYIVGELDAALLGVNIAQLLGSGVLTDDEEAKYAAALNYIYNQLENQTVYPEAGNLWLHSQKSDGTPRPAWVKWNICLDGVYMSQLFLVRLTEVIDSGDAVITGKDGSIVTSEALWADIYSRLSFVMEHMVNPENGLLYHGYCVETGETNQASWSRGIGWYTMVLVEAAEKIPGDSEKAALTAYFNQIMTAVVAQQDEATSLWYNVTDGREEYAYRKTAEDGETVVYNMPESSGSAMFAYCLLRGYHTGLLEDEAFRTAGLRAFNALVETKLTEDGLTDIYTSSSVTSDKNLYQKNGYTTNDGKGVGPLILAANYAY